MSQFGNCKIIVIYKIKEFNDWETTKYELELIFECFECFWDYKTMLWFLENIESSVSAIGRDVATDYIKKKINFYKEMVG